MHFFSLGLMFYVEAILKIVAIFKLQSYHVFEGQCYRTRLAQPAIAHDRI